MDQLSAELITIICTFLKQEDIGHLRCVSKFCANVGRPFMYRRLHLIFTPDGFKRLHEISSNASLAPYVTSLYYEADSLWSYESFEEWEQDIYDPAIYQKLGYIVPPGPESSERALRAHRREMKKLEKRPRHNYSRLQLTTAYEKYRKHVEQQDAMREDNYQARKIADAMVNLTNLEEIFLGLEREPTKRRRKAYSDSYTIPYGDNSGTQPLGVPQMLSLLLSRMTEGHAMGLDDASAAGMPVRSVGGLQGSSQTQKKLKGFCGATVNWRLFKQSDGVFKNLQSAVRDLQELRLDISIGFDDSHEASDEERYECAEYLRNGRVLEFLAAAPNLRLLELRFGWSTSACSADLRYILGKHKWECLANVTLSMCGSREEELVGFFELHAMTLQMLAINQIQLVEGSWLSTFQQMRRLLRLRQVRLCGYMEAFEFDEFWIFTMMESSSETTMSRVVRDYILQGGDGPLLDLSGYDELTLLELEESWRTLSR